MAEGSSASCDVDTLPRCGVDADVSLEDAFDVMWLLRLVDLLRLGAVSHRAALPQAW